MAREGTGEASPRFHSFGGPRTPSRSNVFASQGCRLWDSRGGVWDLYLADRDMLPLIPLLILPLIVGRRKARAELRTARLQVGCWSCWMGARASSDRPSISE